MNIQLCIIQKYMCVYNMFSYMVLYLEWAMNTMTKLLNLIRFFSTDQQCFILQ